MDMMKIEWTGDAMFCPAIGEAKPGTEYTVTEAVGKNLIKQGVAKAVKKTAERRAD